jgi:hypothetical protein
MKIDSDGMPVGPISPVSGDVGVFLFLARILLIHALLLLVAKLKQRWVSLCN